MSKNRRKKQMAKVMISMKIFPTGTDVDFNQLKRKIEKNLPADSSVYKFAEEPIAFGLNALIAHILLPEEKSGGLEEIEKNIQKIEGVSQIQMVMVRRV
jgi:translation elongation factor aEF-1 beta